MERVTFIGWAVNAAGLPPSWKGPYLHVCTSVVVLALIALIAVVVFRRLKRIDVHLVPKGSTSLVNVIEIIIEALLRIMTDVMGKDARRHFPIIGAVFFYILISDLVGVIPGFSPSTDNINTNLAVAIVVFCYYNIAGIRAHGLSGYLKEFSGPIIWLAPLLFVVEIISHIVRPLSLSVRLLGNMYGDHLVVGIFSNIAPIIVPTAFMAMAIFVAFIQAFVFTLLSVIYIALATRTE